MSNSHKKQSSLVNATMKFLKVEKAEAVEILICISISIFAISAIIFLDALFAGIARAETLTNPNNRIIGERMNS